MPQERATSPSSAPTAARNLWGRNALVDATERQKAEMRRMLKEADIGECDTRNDPLRRPSIPA